MPGSPDVETPAPGAPGSDAPAPEPPVRQSTPFLVLQFFIFPLAIVAVCVTVGVFVSMIVLLLLPENFSWQIFFAVGVHIDFGR